MKKFYLFIIAAVIAGLFASCNTEEQIPVMPEDNIFIFEREFALPAITRASGINSSVFSVTVNLATEEVLGYMIEPEVLEYLGLTAKEFDDMLREELGDFYDDLIAEIGAPSTRAEDFGNDLTNCREACMDKYTDANGNKIDGRGKCLTSCYVDRVLTFIENVADAAGGLIGGLIKK